MEGEALEAQSLPCSGFHVTCGSQRDSKRSLSLPSLDTSTRRGHYPTKLTPSPPDPADGSTPPPGSPPETAEGYGRNSLPQELPLLQGYAD
ncbi:hypothetical protein CapIbe_019178 [Capra ibex]